MLPDYQQIEIDLLQCLALRARRTPSCICRWSTSHLRGEVQAPSNPSYPSLTLS